jgi:hypothetical protein
VALVIVQFSKMPRASRLMKFELEWFEGKPLHLRFMFCAAVWAAVQVASDLLTAA